MKVGTDGVLLGAWCSVEPAMRRLLDVGTGTGLIALMLAQRTEACRSASCPESRRFSPEGTEEEPENSSAAVCSDFPRIDAVEIDPQAAEQAKRNVAASPWPERITVLCDSVQHLASAALSSSGSDAVTLAYDLIVSNPPYFTETLLCPDASRTTARHTTQLTYEELLDAAERLLAPAGRLAVVLPADRADRFIAMARVRCLHLARRTDVRSKPDAVPKRALLEFRNMDGCPSWTTTPVMARTPERSSLVISDADGYTQEYRVLTRDFYLNF